MEKGERIWVEESQRKTKISHRTYSAARIETGGSNGALPPGPWQFAWSKGAYARGWGEMKITLLKKRESI